MAKPPAMTIALEHGELVEMLSDTEAGELFKALFNFAENGEVPDFDGMLKMAFVAISNQIKRSADRYELACLRKSIEAKKREEKRRAVEKERQMMPPMQNSANACTYPQSSADVCSSDTNRTYSEDSSKITDIEDIKNVFGDGNVGVGVGGLGGVGEGEREEPISPTTPKSDLQIYADRLKAEKSQ